MICATGAVETEEKEMYFGQFWERKIGEVVSGTSLFEGLVTLLSQHKKRPFTWCQNKASCFLAPPKI